MIHLDTNFLIQASVSGTREAALLDRWISSGEDVGISSVAWCEFLCGPVDAVIAAKASTAFGRPTAFQHDDSTIAARLYNVTGRRRGSLIDCMVAAVALRVGAAIATNNRDDFRRFEPHGLSLR